MLRHRRAAGSRSSRVWKPSENRAELKKFVPAQVSPGSMRTKFSCEKGAIWAKPASQRRLRCSDRLAIPCHCKKAGESLSGTFVDEIDIWARRALAANAIR